MSRFQKVRVGKKYIFEPVFIDRMDMHKHNIVSGSVVTVVNLSGCPKANTMGHCYIQDANKNCTLVCTNSLVDVNEKPITI